MSSFGRNCRLRGATDGASSSATRVERGSGIALAAEHPARSGVHPASLSIMQRTESPGFLWGFRRHSDTSRVFASAATKATQSWLTLSSGRLRLRRSVPTRTPYHGGDILASTQATPGCAGSGPQTLGQRMDGLGAGESLDLIPQPGFRRFGVPSGAVALAKNSRTSLRVTFCSVVYRRRLSARWGSSRVLMIR